MPGPGELMDYDLLLSGQYTIRDRDLNEVVHQLIVETDDKTIKRRRKRLSRE